MLLSGPYLKTRLASPLALREWPNPGCDDTSQTHQPSSTETYQDGAITNILPARCGERHAYCVQLLLLVRSAAKTGEMRKERQTFLRMQLCCTRKRWRRHNVRRGFQCSQITIFNLNNLLNNHGWTDLGAHASKWGGRNHEPTCKSSERAKHSRIDYAVANPRAQNIVRGVRSRFVTAIATHARLEIDLASNRTQPSINVQKKHVSLFGNDQKLHRHRYRGHHR